MRARSITQADLRLALRQLGLSGRPVCVHSSLSSFGSVEDGAQTVVDAFLAEDCTLMVPAFTYEYMTPPPPHERPERNGLDYERFGGEATTKAVFTPEILDVSREMGAIPLAVVKRAGRSRGRHPVNSFSAVGPLAAGLVSGQTALDVYAPFRRLIELEGAVLLMGVGLDTMTLLHYAEQLAGRNLFIRWARAPDGSIARVRVGGCSDGFPKLDPVLSRCELRIAVGGSLWRAFPAGAALHAASAAIREDISITSCGRSGCRRCQDAILGGPREA